MTTLPFSAPIAETIWDLKYRLKDADGTPIDRTVEETWRRIADALAEAETPESREYWAETFYGALDDFKFLPAGRIVAGAGTGRAVTLQNCYIMDTIPDSMEGIFRVLRESALTMQQGGGIGMDFSTLRPKGAPVHGVAADASGPLSFMDCWDSMCRTVMSAGSRRGAMLAALRCDHPDIMDFITAKADPLRFRMFNLSVAVTDAFMDAVRADGPWDLFFDDRHGKRTVYRSVQARDMWDAILLATYDYAEPGVIFIDRMNALNNLRYCEIHSTVNPCGEQNLQPYGACLLGSINLTKFIDEPFSPKASTMWFNLRATVRTAIRMMDNVVDVSNYPLPEQAAEARAKRRLGLGVTGLADALVMLGMTYGSPEAAFWTEAMMKDIATEAYSASVELAREKGAFPAFDADGYLANGTFASTLHPALRVHIRKYGIRNSHLTSIAPTGTISLYAGNVSSGIEPIFALSYDRKILQPDGSRAVETVEDYAVRLYRDYHEMHLDGDEHGNPIPSVLPDTFVTAQTLTPHDHIVMQAAAQKWVDSSISKTTNVPEDISFDDFKAVYDMAYDMGCKGCTTYRPNDVTGSVLSVAAPEAPAVASVMAGLSSLAAFDASDYVEGPRCWSCDVPLHTYTNDNGDEACSNCDTILYDHKLWAAANVTPTPVATTLSERPKAVDGTTYKLRFPNVPHAMYITINDIERDDGVLAPYEMFINSKNMDSFAWVMTMTRMISAIFRRGGDVTFVVKELQEVWDPKGGAYVDGAYVPSVSAAIGGVLERHMKAIGYIQSEDASARVPPGVATGDHVAQQEASSQFKSSRTMYAQDLNAGSTDAAPAGVASGNLQGKDICPQCFSPNYHAAGGCFTCGDCGHSKCG